MNCERIKIKQTKKEETELSEFALFVQKYGLGEKKGTHEIKSTITDLATGNCCGQCEFCPLA